MKKFISKSVDISFFYNYFHMRNIEIILSQIIYSLRKFKIYKVLATFNA